MKSKVYKGVCEICQKTVSYYYLEKHMLRKHQNKNSSFSVNEKDKSISNPPNMKRKNKVNQNYKNPKGTIASKSKIVKKTRLKKSVKKGGKMVSNLQTNEVDIEIKQEMENQESNTDVISGDISDPSSIAQWYISLNKGVSKVKTSGAFATYKGGTYQNNSMFLLSSKCHFGCGISKIDGPKQQDFWPKIHTINIEFV